MKSGVLMLLALSWCAVSLAEIPNPHRNSTPHPLADFSDGCWVLMYGNENFKDNVMTFKGEKRVRKLNHRYVRKLTVEGTALRNDRADSVIVGPSATLTIYDSENFKGGNASIKSGSRVAEMEDIRVGDDFDSFEITCRKNSRGFYGSNPYDPYDNVDFSRGCWVQMFGSEDFTGDVMTFKGQQKIENLDEDYLRNYTVEGSALQYDRADSVRTGPNTRLTIYRSENFRGSKKVIGADQQIGEFDSVRYGGSYDSFKIECF